MNDAPQDVAQDATGRVQDLAFGGAGGMRPPRHATTTATAAFVFAQVAMC